jgi:hypothetical protein
MAKFLFTMIFVAAGCGKGANKPADNKPADNKPADTKGPHPKSDVDTAKYELEKLNFESFPNWASEHPDKACPASLGELDGGKAKDPWGNPYKMFCGANLPAGAHGGFAVLSFGPDGKEGTTDDLMSWDK